tara:strand:+ start:1400 stop:2587 length:1188 start_codon:yes stop_codon:yes gene_type:complete
MTNRVKRMINTVLKDYTLIGKIFFSLYNVLSIVLLNVFFSKEISGNFLFVLSQVLLITTFSRLGSDFYWSSSETPKKILIVKNELFIHLIITLIVSLSFFAVLVGSTFFDFFFILMVISLSNLMQIMGRHFQKHEKHVISLFLFTVGPIGVSVPLLMIFDHLPLMAIIAISNLCICAPFVKHFLSNIELEVEATSFFKRLSFMPMLAFGTFNQHLITQLSGLNAREAEIALLILIQRIAGLISWPLVLFMQTELLQLSQSTKSKDLFILNIKNYILKYSPLLVTLTIISLISSVIVMHFEKELSLVGFFAITTITIACLGNAMFAFIQYQMGLKGMTSELSTIIFTSLLLSISFYYFTDTNMISASISFLLFHLFTHSASTVFLARKIKFDQKDI